MATPQQLQMRERDEESLSSSPLASRAQRIGTTLTAAVPIRKGREPTRAENRAQLKLVHNMDHCQT